jgi:cobaltochelatase CobS
MNEDAKITCKLCGAQVHVMKKHLQDHHQNVSLADYEAQFPGEPTLSPRAQKLMEEELKKRQGAAAPAAPAPAAVSATYTGLAAYKAEKKALHEVFALGNVKAAMSSTSNNPIPITVLKDVGAPDMVPKTDDGYVFDIDELKNVMLAMELNIPTYVYGHKGAGKSELFEQIAGRTGRPAIRLQHTINTEEVHIVGQWIVKEGETVFNLGPLPQAMMNGWVYIADEYDFALPSVTSVYQAVLEGKPLYIKDAPHELRLIKPHPNFRFCATGNTNGSGDETGLYQGTNVQNSANYDRFGMMIHKQYMPKQAEEKIIRNRVGLAADDAKRMVEFATLVRTAYSDGKISDTISPRALINAGRIGVARASFRQGLSLAFINKLSSVDRKVVDDIAQRVFA